MSDIEDIYKKALNLTLENEDNPEVDLLLEIAADKGSKDAAFAFGIRIFKRGVVEKYSVAHSFMKHVADNGNAEAAFNTGVSYEKGHGTKIDKKMALKYYLKGAMAGDEDAAFEFYRCLYYGIGTNPNKSLANIFKSEMISGRNFKWRDQ